MNAAEHRAREARRKKAVAEAREKHPDAEIKAFFYGTAEVYVEVWSPVGCTIYTYDEDDE